MSSKVAILGQTDFSRGTAGVVDFSTDPAADSTSPYFLSVSISSGSAGYFVSSGSGATSSGLYVAANSISHQVGPFLVADFPQLYVGGAVSGSVSFLNVRSEV